MTITDLKKFIIMKSCVHFNKIDCGCAENRCSIKPDPDHHPQGDYVTHEECFHCIDNHINFQSKMPVQPLPPKEGGMAALAKFAGITPWAKINPFTASSNDPHTPTTTSSQEASKS
jgi:hypothetical protein